MMRLRPSCQLNFGPKVDNIDNLWGCTPHPAMAKPEELGTLHISLPHPFALEIGESPGILQIF